MHATEAESEGLATFGGGIGSMLPMQRNSTSLLLRMHATEAESKGLATFGGGIGSMLPM